MTVFGNGINSLSGLIYFCVRLIAAQHLRARSWRIGLCLLCQLTVLDAARAVEAIQPDPDELMYQEAQTDLSRGNTQEGIAKLNTLVARAPLHLGALLDLAIAYCQSNAPLEAEARFSRLRQYPELPPAIAELISYYGERCRPPSSAWRGFVALGSGQANNLNQSPSAEHFFLAPLDLTLQLADSARPRNDSYRVTEAGISHPIQESGWAGGFLVQQVDYRRSNDYDTLLGLAKASYRFHKSGFRLELQGSASQLNLGGKSYLTALSTNFSAMRPLSSDGFWQIGGVASLADLDYRQMPDYRARIVDARGRLQWQPSSQLRLLGEVGSIRDTALKHRPGGNKNGQVIQISGQWQLNAHHFLEFFHSQTWMTDETAYSPAFFGDVKRRPHLSSWYAAWRYQLPENFQLRLEARHGANQDTISLFDYRSSAVAILLEWWSK